MPTLAEIAQLLNCPPPPGAEQVAIAGVAAVDEATPDQITLVTTDRYAQQLASTKAAAAIVQKRVKVPAGWENRSLVVDDCELASIRVLELFAPPVPRPAAGVDPTARVAPTAQIAENVAIGPHVVIGHNCRIGTGTVLHAGVFVGNDVVVGEACEFFPHVVIRERITIGSRVVIHAGTVLGTDGFGYRWNGRQHLKVPQIGTIVVEDDVEIGSCVCIDRAKFGATRVGCGTKIDNLVQVGHNVQIGPHCIIVGQVGLAGSAKLGAGVVLGGQCAVRDHVQMGDGAAGAACSAVAEDVPPQTIVSGTPALPHRQSLREQAALRRLPDLVVQVRKLQEQIDELQKRVAG